MRSEMSLEMSSRRESLLALVAQKWFLSEMPADVYVQVAFSSKCRLAYVAIVRLLLGVRTKMRLEIVAARKYSATHVAF